MEQTTTLDALRAWRAAHPGELGLVPTMGALHAGHLSLVERARAENKLVGVSIFVNPTQFNDSGDLAAYPRDTARDLNLLRPIGVDVVWLPNPDAMYPPGYQTWVEVAEVTQPLEGAHRPGHFRGVTTVVAKLFNAFTPQRAYLGQKDAQQVAVIKQMVRDLSYPLDIVACPIVREADGLAMSSRNALLPPAERAAATVLHIALNAAVAACESGERDANALRDTMRAVIDAEPLARAEYVSVADRITLRELDTVTTGALFSMAVYVGGVRLIDNMVVDQE